MSCEMVFGQTPPPIEEDKAFKQPCFATLCELHCRFVFAISRICEGQTFLEMPTNLVEPHAGLAGVPPDYFWLQACLPDN
jgi:hypothetical protein